MAEQADGANVTPAAAGGADPGADAMFDGGAPAEDPERVAAGGQAAPDTGAASPGEQDAEEPDGEEPDGEAPAEPEGAAQPEPPEPALPDWWKDEQAAAPPAGPAPPAAPTAPSAGADQPPAPAGLLSEAERSQAADALYGPLTGEEDEEYRTARTRGVEAVERMILAGIGRALRGVSSTSQRAEEQRQAAAAKVSAAWDQVFTAPELAPFRGGAEEQDILDVAEGVLLRAGYGIADGQGLRLDYARLAGMSRAEAVNLIRAVQERAVRLLKGRTPTAADASSGTVVGATATGARATRSAGFGERPAPTRPAGQGQKKRAGDDAFFEGLQNAGPPIG